MISIFTFTIHLVWLDCKTLGKTLHKGQIISRYWETKYKKRHSRLLMELPILIMLTRGTNALYGRHVLKIYVYKNIGHNTALLVWVDVLFPNSNTQSWFFFCRKLGFSNFLMEGKLWQCFRQHLRKNWSICQSVRQFQDLKNRCKLQESKIFAENEVFPIFRSMENSKNFFVNICK